MPMDARERLRLIPEYFTSLYFFSWIWEIERGDLYILYIQSSSAF
jgi:hypothetical protein